MEPADKCDDPNADVVGSIEKWYKNQITTKIISDWPKGSEHFLKLSWMSPFQDK